MFYVFSCRRCQALGGHLAYISSSEEMEVFYQAFTLNPDHVGEVPVFHTGFLNDRAKFFKTVEHGGKK